MASLEDRILGNTGGDNYCSSSSSDDDSDDDTAASSGKAGCGPAAEQRTANMEYPRRAGGPSVNTGVKGVIQDYQRWRQLEVERRSADDKERERLAKQLSMTCRSQRDDEEAKIREARAQDDLEALVEDDDVVLRQYMERRMKEMAASMAKKLEISLGTLSDLTNADAFAKCIEKDSVHCTIVIHIYEPDAVGCEAMNGCLQWLAQKYSSMKFYRILASVLPVSQSFRNALPTIQAYRNGELTGSFVRMTDTFGTDFYADQVEQYLKENIYVPMIKSHVTYESAQQFRDDYGQWLNNTFSAEDVRTIENLAESEALRRRQADLDAKNRKTFIASHFKPALPELYSFKTAYLQSEFVQLVQDPITLLPTYNLSSQFQLYHFPVFSDEFCRNFCEELRCFHAADLPRTQPNTMNRYGVNLEELGFTPFLDAFRKQCLNPVAKCAFPGWVVKELDSHKAFTVSYELEQDTDLDTHFDNAEVTLNVCLNDEFDDGEIYFMGMHGENTVDRMQHYGVKHRRGWGILHRARQLHGALPITAGKRHNFIIWLRCSSIRNMLCPMCQKAPNLVPAEDYGDGFTALSVDLCSVL